MKFLREQKKIQNRKLRTNCKSKRLKVLIKNAYEIAVQCDLKIDLSVFDPAINKIQEFYTDNDFKQKQVSELRSRCELP